MKQLELIKKLIHENLKLINNFKPNKFIYHKSNPNYRNIINKEGLQPQKGDQWLDDTRINKKAIFATNSDNKNDWFDSTYDDDIWQIDTSKIPNIKWYPDPNFNWKKNNKHIFTIQPILRNVIKLIKKGTGNSLIEIIMENTNRIGFSIEDIFNLIDYSDSYKDLYPNYNPEFQNEYEDDYYFKSKNDAYNDVNDLLEFYNNLPNPIPIYRSIKVKNIEDIDYSYLGDSWSFDKQSAINFARNHNLGNILLSAYTDFSNIDWKETIRNHFLFSREDDNDAENELKVIDTDHIKNLKVEKI